MDELRESIISEVDSVIYYRDTLSKINGEIDALLAGQKLEGPISEFMVGALEDIGPPEDQDPTFEAPSIEDALDAALGETITEDTPESSQAAL